MDPVDFRRDPWLRTSGYHLATWSLAAFVLELRRTVPGSEGDAAFAVVIAGGALLTSVTHERRVGKMAGIAGDPMFPRTPLLWNSALLVLAFGSVAALTVSRLEWLFPLWMIVAGGGFFLWGRGLRFVWYAGLGASMLAAGLVDLALPSAGTASQALRLVVLGVVLPAMGLLSSYRYLWFRAPLTPPVP